MASPDGKVLNSSCDYERQRTARLSTFILIANFLAVLLDMTDISHRITEPGERRKAFVVKRRLSRRCSVFLAAYLLSVSQRKSFSAIDEVGASDR